MRDRRLLGSGHSVSVALALSVILMGTATLAAAAQSPTSAAPTLAVVDPCRVLSASFAPTAPAAPVALIPAGSAHPGPSPERSPAPVASCADVMAIGAGDASGAPETARVATLGTPDVSTTAFMVGSPRSHAPGRIRVRTNVPFMYRQACAESRSGCVNLADIYYPSGRGPWPVIVTIHGRPRYPDDMQEFAVTLAANGAVVFNIDYRGVRPAYTKGFPESIADVACGVRYARQYARRYGGDRDHVVLVGHSMGGYVGAMVALAGNTFPSGSCSSTLGMRASLPDGFVSVAGVSVVHPSYRIDQAFFGGMAEQIPGVWRRGTIYTHIGRHIGLNHHLKVGIIFERHDPFLGIGHATYLHQALRRAGYDSHLVLLDQGTTHFDILDTDRAIGRRVVQLVWQIVRESDDG